MTNNLKIKKYWITTFCLVFFSLFSFAQELSDETIGFDVARTTTSLKERGIKNEDMELQILKARKVQLTQYLEIKQIEDSYLKKIKFGQTNKITAEVPQSEKDALKALYDGTNGDSWTNKTGWDFSTPVTSWNGSTKTGWYGVNVANGHVATLELSNNNLNNGTNAFPNLSTLTDLISLGLSMNPLKGSMAPIGSITSLRIISLGYNNFSDTTIPESFQNLTNLDFLAIQTMGFSQTSDLVFIANKFPKLKTLNLSINNYSGPLPNELQNLTNLKSIYIEQNKISDISVIGNMTGLANVFLSTNKITSIPSNFSNLINLEQISVGDNQISGAIPSYIQNYSMLRTLWLGNNLFEGKIPDLTNLTKLNNVIISNNKFRFVDFANEFPIYKTRFTSFSYYKQANTDSAETINKATGSSVTLSMSDDGIHRYTDNDKFKWYKGNYPSGILVSQDESRQLTISNLNSSHAGNYYCLSTNPEITNPLNTSQNLVLLREPITLKIVNCPTIQGSITSTTDKFHTNAESTFAFESTTTTGLTYQWSVTPENGTTTSNTLNSYTHTFTEAGDYEVKLIITDSTGCTTDFTKSIKVEERYCDNEPVDFSFETTATNLTYTWTATDSTGRVVNRVTDTTGLYTFTPQVSGEYVIELVASSATSCKTLFTKNITIDQCTPYISCTKDNPLSPEIHNLFINMITKLASAPTGTDVNVYAHKEIAAVAPYTTEKIAKIFNFTNTSSGIGFSFTNNGIDDVFIPKSASGSITAIDLSKYVDSVTSTIVATNYSNGTTNNSDGHVKNIDFCPKELSCVSHIALVVDESGSLDASEINKIKKQLKLFVAQQAYTNDDIGSNIYVSLTGMSDTDDVKNRRTDHIEPLKMTAGNLYRFNDWINNLGKRYGKTGISQASDFWKSGLDVPLSYEMKPTFVLMITDGAQTDNVAELKATLAKFDNNNKTITEPKLPHLYVVGIENGIYVDRDSYTTKLSRDLDPNYNPSLGSNNNLTAKTTPFLRKSLQYLLDLSPTEFPVSDINQFNVGTYYGHSNFDLLSSDETYFADKVVTGHFACGTPAIKDFCDDCFSFKPEPGKDYILSAWVKEESNEQVKTYTNPLIKLVFYNNKEALDIPAHKIDSLSIKASGDIIDGWQRVVQKFKIPTATITIGIELENLSPSIPVYFDDIRIHPLQGSVKSFVYDPETFKLMSELDENNYSTFYEYDNEGGLVRVKKETAKGIKTIQETRSGNVITPTSNP